MSQDQSQLSPVVELVNSRPATTSLKIAECFGKEHKNVLADIRNLIVDCPENFNELNFQPVEYQDAKGEKRPMYTVFFDGFMLLVMGYTGKKALAMKLAYIQAFNAMREKLEQSRQAALGGDRTITPFMQSMIQTLVRARVEGLCRGKSAQGYYPQVYSRFNSHFNIPRYTELPQSRMNEAVEYLVNMEIRTKKVETAREQPELPEGSAMIDHETYLAGKDLFDLLNDIKWRLETVAARLLLSQAPRSMYLEKEKMVLYDNLTDCVRAATAGVNIASYNVRSACRIKGRVSFIGK